MSTRASPGALERIHGAHQRLHSLGRNLDTFGLALLLFETLKVASVFALEMKLSKTLSGLVYFVPYLYGGRSPPYNCNTKYISPLRVFDIFNAKAKTQATLKFSKIKSAQGFCFGIEVVKNSEGACVFCIAVIGGASPPV